MTLVRIAKLLLLAKVVGACALVWMFFYHRTVAEKLLTSLAMPTGIFWSLAGLIVIVAGYRRQRLIARLAFALWLGIAICGNSFFAILLVRTLERPYLSINPLDQAPFNAVVVLGGHTAVGSNGVTRLEWSGDRVMMAIRMYHDDLTERIICTGTRIQALDRDGKDQKDMAAELCEAAGVPAEKIEFVDGINTYEEISSLAEKLESGERVGLITSAFHMRRALALANSHGLELEPLPAHMITPPIVVPRVTDFVPDASALQITRVALKEYLARLVGR